jgi:hypothetical protein
MNPAGATELRPLHADLVVFDGDGLNGYASETADDGRTALIPLAIPRRIALTSSRHVTPVEGDPRAWNTTLAKIEELPQPVLAAINGQCWGGGCELALACAARVAARSATLAQPEVAAGIIPGAGGTERLPRLVGPGRALELVLTARPVVADEAAAIGLLEVVLPDDGFLESAIDWARSIALHQRSALVAAKRAIHDGLAAAAVGGASTGGATVRRVSVGSGDAGDAGPDPRALSLHAAGRAGAVLMCRER